MSPSSATPSTNTPAPRFSYSATLRVMCAPDRHDEIERVTGLTATHRHQHGEPSFFGEPWPNDLWALESPLPPGAALSDHLCWLWEQVRPHQAYVRSLVDDDGIDVDLFLGYRSNCGECGFEICPDALAITQALGIPLEVSVIFSPPEASPSGRS
ncbi:MAG: DUF4279 domain-containing protein [Bacteroidetes bacterium]|nr:DUF4279 domain-containing protein [Bacteroidota bacterium]